MIGGPTVIVLLFFLNKTSVVSNRKIVDFGEN